MNQLALKFLFLLVLACPALALTGGEPTTISRPSFTDVSLNTGRLKLRDFQVSDLQNHRLETLFFELYENIACAQYLFFSSPPSRAHSYGIIHEALLAQYENSRSYYLLAIVEKGSEDVVGHVRIRRNLDLADAGDWVIGWGVVGSRQGKKYAREAVRRAIQFAFYDLEVDHLTARIDPDNEPSVRLADSLDFVHYPERHFDKDHWTGKRVARAAYVLKNYLKSN